MVSGETGSSGWCIREYVSSIDLAFQRQGSYVFRVSHEHEAA